MLIFPIWFIKIFYVLGLFFWWCRLCSVQKSPQITSDQRFDKLSHLWSGGQWGWRSSSWSLHEEPQYYIGRFKRWKGTEKIFSLWTQRSSFFKLGLFSFWAILQFYCLGPLRKDLTFEKNISRWPEVTKYFWLMIYWNSI